MVGQVAHVPSTCERELHCESEGVEFLGSVASFAAGDSSAVIIGGVGGGGDAGLCLPPTPLRDEVVLVVGHI